MLAFQAARRSHDRRAAVQSRRAAADDRLRHVGVRPSDCGDRARARAAGPAGRQPRVAPRHHGRARRRPRLPAARSGAASRNGRTTSAREPPTESATCWTDSSRCRGCTIAIEVDAARLRPSDNPGRARRSIAHSRRGRLGAGDSDRADARRSARLLAATRRLSAAVMTSAAALRAHAPGGPRRDGRRSRCCCAISPGGRPPSSRAQPSRSTASCCRDRRHPSLSHGGAHARLLGRHAALSAVGAPPAVRLPRAPRHRCGGMGHPRGRRRHGHDCRHARRRTASPVEPRQERRGIARAISVRRRGGRVPGLVVPAGGDSRAQSVVLAGASPFAAAAVAALAETIPIRLDDNLTVPMTAARRAVGGVVDATATRSPRRLPTRFARFPIGAALNMVVAVAGHRARTVSTSGAIVGACIGTAIYRDRRLAGLGAADGHVSRRVRHVAARASAQDAARHRGGARRTARRGKRDREYRRRRARSAAGGHDARDRRCDDWLRRGADRRRKRHGRQRDRQGARSPYLHGPHAVGRAARNARRDFARGHSRGSRRRVCAGGHRGRARTRAAIDACRNRGRRDARRLRGERARRDARAPGDPEQRRAEFPQHRDCRRRRRSPS